MAMRENSNGSQGTHAPQLISMSSSSNTGAGIGTIPNKQAGNKFINPNKMPMNTNYVHRMSGGAPIESQNSRMNDILLESQKMIYAPPSREKTKQSMRSPLLEKGKVPVEEYSLAASNTLYQGQMGGRKKGPTSQQQAHFNPSQGGKYSLGGNGGRI